eukprot:TRINITY_DN8550_c0_g1_i1.p1 TRINITY_DN8550_c0_g1~~TRINITY_DN8550_c0_g1_i1.p1  ORF type:complete len:434 (+),score=122.48 TRINITY_DN8550_c0_g1_i1:38-1303(+)
MTNHLFLGLDHKALYPGKPVKGFIVLLVQTPITVSRIGVHFKGVEYVSWYQGVTQKENCTVSEDLFSDDIVLVDSENGHTFLEEGTHTFPFEFLLPEGLPSSYEENPTEGGALSGIFSNYVIPANGIIPMSFGEQKSFIRYFCKSFVDTVIEEVVEDEVQARTLRMEKDLYFKVVEAFDPTILIQKPKKIGTKKTFFLSGDPVELRVSLANGGVLFTGQNLFLHLFCKNGATRWVNQLVIKLVEHIAFTAVDANGQEQLMHRKNVVINARVDDSAIDKGCTFDKDLMLPVPNTVSGTIHCSTHISRQYELLVDAEMQVGGKVTVALPVLLLQWSPLIKDDVPEVVPIKISRKKAEDVEIEDDQDIEVVEEENQPVDTVEPSSESIEAIIESQPEPTEPTEGDSEPVEDDSTDILRSSTDEA